MTIVDIGAASQGAAAALCIEGELTIYRAAELKPVLLDAVQQALDAGLAPAFDLSDVTEFDSAGMQLLLLAQRIAAGQGQALQLLACSPAVREVFTLTGMMERFGQEAP